MYGLVSEGIKGNCMRVLFESDSGRVTKLCQARFSIAQVVSV